MQLYNRVGRGICVFANILLVIQPCVECGTVRRNLLNSCFVWKEYTTRTFGEEHTVYYAVVGSQR